MTVGVSHNPPIAFRATDGSPSGFGIDVLNDIARKNEWSLNFIYDTWPNLLHRLEAGEIDIQMGIAYSAARAERYDFNIEPLVVNWAVLYRSPHSLFTAINSLEGVKVALVPSATHSRAFLELLKNFNVTASVVSVADYAQAFAAVKTRQADFAVVSRLYGILNAKKFDVVETAMNFNPVEVRFAAPKGRNANLLAQIDSYLRKAKADSGSKYHEYLKASLAEIDRNRIPDWVFSVIVVISGTLVLSVIVVWWLRREIKLRTRSLQDSERKLIEAQIISRTGDFLWDLKTDSITWSTGLYKMLGYRGDESLSPEFLRQMVRRSEDSDRVMNWIEQGISERQEALPPLTYQIRRMNGDIIHVETNIRIEYLNEKAVRLFGTCHDISDRIRTEQALLQALSDAGKANDAKSDFLASMSHELRTPLNAILGFAQLLQIDIDKKLSEVQADYVDSVVRGGTHLLALVNDLLDLSRIESDQLTLSYDAVDAYDIVCESINQVWALAKQRGIKIENCIDANSKYKLKADRLRLRQVLLNLLSNAIKYNHQDGVVTVSAENNDHSRLRIVVADTGIGISERHKMHVFQAFNRLGASPMVTNEGAGIGLTVTKFLIERMGGHIDFESTEGAGSKFWFDLPVATDADATADM